MDPVTAGSLIGRRYRLVTRRRSGGTAEIWLAHDEVADRRVAVKIPSNSVGFVRQTPGEQAAIAAVQHPSLVAILDHVGDAPTTLVLEWIEGTDLRSLLDSGPLPIGRIIDMTLDLADALDAVHRVGLVHRDVKPANIMLTDDGMVKLTDFDTAVTAVDSACPTGDIVGTAKYMSPEQVRGHQLDGRSDTFSLCVVLYEAITGRPPYLGVSEIATAMARFEGTPADPRQIRPDTPAELASVVMRGLNLSPDERWFRPTLSRTPMEITTSHRPLWPRMVAMLIALAIAALGSGLVASGIAHLTG